jgi:hypothetical protein
MELNLPANYKPTDADREHAEAQQELARLLSKTHLPILVTRLVENSMSDAASHKQIMDTADYLYRVSGLSAKQEAKQSTGATIIFNLSGGKTLTVSDKAASPPLQHDNEPLDVLDVVPTYLSNLDLNINDDLTLDDLDNE